MGSNADLLQGTLDLLILRTLAVGAMHGWGIAQRIQQVSNDVLQDGQGSLYPALHRLEYKGWIRAEWAPRKAIGGQSITRLQPGEKGNWKWNAISGTGWRRPLRWCLTRREARRNDFG
jgi:DNA-binding PadR family transcriptional regulator